MNNLLLLHGLRVQISFKDSKFKVLYKESKIKIALDESNFVNLSLENQQVSYKATILGGFSLAEEKVGKIDYTEHLMVNWSDDLSAPELVFKKKPIKICRNYKKGQKIELGIEHVSSYHVVYKDDVTADFIKTGENAYNFSFSTGFDGNIWKDSDGSHSIKFKGIRLDAEDDGYNSESKFIISRSKYTDALILILQDDATVYLKF